MQAKHFELWYLPVVFVNSIKVAAIGLFLVTICMPSNAAAYDNQITLGGDFGFAERFADKGPHHGGMFSLVSSVGLDDIWTVRGRFSYSVHEGPDLLSAFFLSAELLYLVDIFEFVPFFGGGPDGVATLYKGKAEVDAALHAVVGVDYLFSRKVIVGLEVRPLFFLTGIKTHLAYLSVDATVSYGFDM
jgi:hypothetical protein